MRRRRWQLGAPRPVCKLLTGAGTFCKLLTVTSAFGNTREAEEARLATILAEKEREEANGTVPPSAHWRIANVWQLWIHILVCI